MSDDDDKPWKEAIAHYFADFMAFYFPDAHAAIDWSRPHIFLDQELAALTRAGEARPRRLDKLVRVYLRHGGEQWVLIHLEVQSQRDSGFAERIFTYHYRVYDHYRRPVASLALLADRGLQWRPSSFGYDLLNCRMSLIFPIVKLSDYMDGLGELLRHTNPFALITAVHLLTQRTRTRPHQRRQVKWRLTRLIYARDWDRRRIIDVLRVMDWMMYLPDAMRQRFNTAVYLMERRQAMPYVTSFERDGIKKGRKLGIEEGREVGRQQGRLELLAEFLAARFGDPAEALHGRLAGASAEQLLAWGRRAANAATLDEVFRD